MGIRSVAVFHCGASFESAWTCAEGIVDALNEMGFQTLDCGNPRVQLVDFDHLKSVDLIILSGLEWYEPYLKRNYGSKWLDLRAPKVAWYTESFHRDDREFYYSRVNILADIHYFPAAQDAAEFGGRWLPFGVDLNVFKPRTIPKTHKVAFLGQMYEKRRRYLEALGFPIERAEAAQDDDPKRSFEFLAQAYGSIEIFVNLPAYSRLLVTKITEVMACRTMLVTPTIDHPSARRNMDLFQSGRHLVYYRPDKPSELRDILNYYSTHPKEAEDIAEAGWRETVTKHGIRNRIHAILDDVDGLGAAAAGAAKPIRPQRPAPEQPAPGIGLHVLLSHHLTLLYFDPEAGVIRHADWGTCPLNLAMEVNADARSRLVIIEGPLMERRDVGDGELTGMTLAEGGAPEMFEIERLSDGAHAFKSDGLYLSADADGLVRRDRSVCLQWEQFRLVPAGLAAL